MNSIKNSSANSDGAPLFGQLASQVIYKMPLGVVTFDDQLKIIDSNPRARDLLSLSDTIFDTLDRGGSKALHDGWAEQFKQILGSSSTHHFEPVSYTKDGRSFTLQMICTPLADEQTQGIIGGVLLVENVTIKLAMANDLAEAERLAAVGKLAARVAHELNNPLDGILRYINLAIRVMENNNPNQATHYLTESRKGLLRMVQIISELLEFSRSTYSAFEEADINKIVEESAKSMEGLAADQKVELFKSYCSHMPNIRSGNLFQVFSNLIKNAIDAMPGGGRLDIQTRCDDHDAIMTFSDTGTGFPEDVGGKLFEPFFTTKDVGKGTGLGLAICKDIIERYSGRIEAANRPEGGSVFTIRIPIECTRGLRSPTGAGIISFGKRS